ncbi:MAG TPA: 3-deoxy-7-phosphoheptulonate synthase, partial [Terriglobia bacterium]|nr:3-deoxy-7-phosphoheptulonate synthase [Terriglobia bacterium]
MVVVMEEGATEEQIQHVIDRLMKLGFDAHRSTGARQTVIGAVGAKIDFDTRDIELIGGVDEVV